MARQPRLRLQFTPKSLLENIQQMYCSLHDKIAKTNKEITLISNMIKTIDNAVIVTQLLSNLEKSIATANAQKLEIIRIQKDVILAQNKENKAKVEKEEAISDDKIIELQRRFKVLKEQKDDLYED